MDIKCSRLAFTYRGPYIDIYRLYLINCHNLNTHFLHIENVGSLQKSSFSFNVENLKVNSNNLLSKTNCKDIKTPLVLNNIFNEKNHNISSIKDSSKFLPDFILNYDKKGNYPDMDISYLRNPMVYMLKRANTNENSEVSDSYEAHSAQAEEKAKMERDLSLVQKLITEFSHSSKSPESF